MGKSDHSSIVRFYEKLAQIEVKRQSQITESGPRT
jgi:hypothetical protein